MALLSTRLAMTATLFYATKPGGFGTHGPRLRITRTDGPMFGVHFSLNVAPMSPRSLNCRYFDQHSGRMLSFMKYSLAGELPVRIQE
jgi:hypothetical protein